MKKLLTIISGQDKKQINESAVAECGAMPANMPPQTPPVSMNMSLNAQGVDQIKELLSLMSQADASRISPPMAMPAPGMDMPIKIGGDEGPKEPDMRSLIKLAGSPEKEEAFANEPDEKLGDLDDAVPSGDDLHKEKKMFKKAQDGDNPMAAEGQLKSTLMKLYQEIKEGKKSKPDFLDMDKDGNKKEPMKKAIADKKKVEEGFDADAKVGDTFKTAKGTTTKTATGLKHTRDKYDYDPGSDDKDDKKMKRKAKKNEDIEEGFDADAKPGDTFKTAKGVSTKTKTGLVHKRTKFDYDPGSDDKDDKKMKRDAKKKK